MFLLLRITMWCNHGLAILFPALIVKVFALLVAVLLISLIKFEFTGIASPERLPTDVVPRYRYAVAGSFGVSS